MLETFTGLQMWTLTLDPSLFDSPASSLQYVKEKRCVARLVRDLKRRGFLHSERYFYVVEWQANGMPHFHLLVDASFVPFKEVCEIWNRFRPASAGPVQGDRPAFGSVRFSAPKFANSKHAANYACKYVIKHPEQGYPDWVLDSTSIHRYGCSRGLLKSERSKSVRESNENEEPDNGHDATCFCAECRGEIEEPEAAKACARTIRERVAECGTRAVVGVVRELMLADGELVEEFVFIGPSILPFQEVRSALGVKPTFEGRRLPITLEEARRFVVGFVQEVGGESRHYSLPEPASSFHKGKVRGF